MPDLPISQLTVLAGTPDIADLLAMVDVSDVTQSVNGTTKFMTVQELSNAIGAADYSNNGDVAGADRTLGNIDAFDQGFITNNVNRFNIDESGNIVINETGADIDFRIEGDTQPSLFFTDGGQDFVGIRTSVPSAPLHIQSNINDHIRLQTAAGTADRYRMFLGDGTGGFADQEIYHVISGSSHHFRITTTEFLTLALTGGVGIKNASPAINTLDSTIPARFISNNTTGVNIVTDTTIDSALYIGTNNNLTGRAKLLVDDASNFVHLQGANTDILLGS